VTPDRLFARRHRVDGPCAVGPGAGVGQDLRIRCTDAPGLAVVVRSGSRCRRIRRRCSG
jgi:hypothetical protein